MHATVCRTNLAYQRYWEGRTQLQTLTSKLSDVAALGITLDSLPYSLRPTKELLLEHWRFKVVYVHLISLLHAVALATLRKDYKLKNLEVRRLHLRRKLQCTTMRLFTFFLDSNAACAVHMRSVVCSMQRFAGLGPLARRLKSSSFCFHAGTPAAVSASSESSPRLQGMTELPTLQGHDSGIAVHAELQPLRTGGNAIDTSDALDTPPSVPLGNIWGSDDIDLLPTHHKQSKHRKYRMSCFNRCRRALTSFLNMFILSASPAAFMLQANSNQPALVPSRSTCTILAHRRSSPINCMCLKAQWWCQMPLCCDRPGAAFECAPGAVCCQHHWGACMQGQEMRRRRDGMHAVSCRCCTMYQSGRATSWWLQSQMSRGLTHALRTQ
jgi:hypothetical protein